MTRSDTRDTRATPTPPAAAPTAAASSPSGGRGDLACPHRPACPGCPQAESAYPAQLAAKRARLGHALAAFAELGHVTLPEVVGASPRTGYRHRLKWAVDGAGSVGLFATDHRVLDLPGCPVAHPLANEVADTIRRLARDPRHAAIAKSLTGVDVRIVEGPRPRAMVTLVLSGEHGPANAFVAALVAARPEIVTVAESPRAPRSAQLLGGVPRVVHGGEAHDDHNPDGVVRARPGSFVQAHREQTARIAGILVAEVKRVEVELGRPVRVLELFAGSGGLGLALARNGATVTMVDAFAPALADVEALAQHERLGVRAVAADAEKYLASVRAGDHDVLLLDPPRRGVGPAARREIARIGPRAALYLSCSPETFSRDLAHFAHLGLAPARLASFDMMPHTDEVESLAVLEPRDAPVDRAIGERAVDKPPHVPCTTRGAFDLPDDASGVWVARGDADRGLVVSGLAVVKGVPRARGHLAGGRNGRPAVYRRLAVASGHALVRFEGIGVGELRKQMTRFGHPILGDRRHADERTLKHMFDAHGLDRLALHVDRVETSDGHALVSPLPGDLALVLESLGFAPGAVAAPTTPPESTSIPER